MADDSDDDRSSSSLFAFLPTSLECEILTTPSSFDYLNPHQPLPPQQMRYVDNDASAAPSARSNRQQHYEGANDENNIEMKTTLTTTSGALSAISSPQSPSSEPAPASPPIKRTNLTFYEDSPQRRIHVQSNSHPSKTLYDNWSCDEDNMGLKNKNNTSSRRSKNRSKRRNNNDGGNHANNTNNNTTEEASDIGWTILSTFLKGWFCIWILFAIAAIGTSISRPHHGNRKKILNQQQTDEQPFEIANIHDAIHATSVSAAEGGGDVTTLDLLGNYYNDDYVNDEQILLAISEQVVTKCSLDNLDTNFGRGECQLLCQSHMCCFIGLDDDGTFATDNDDADFKGCASDPEKMCAVYAGCEVLVTIFNDDFSSDSSEKENAISDTAKIPPMPTQQTITPPSSFSSSSSTATTNNAELQLISQVITIACSNDNLHTRHGMQECAALCTQSVCCFDRHEIESLNPKMDIILKMEGVNDKLLDRNAIGTCSNDFDESSHNGDGAVDTDTLLSSASSIQQQTNHFCNVHAGCKNLLLFGSHSNPNINKKHPSSGKGTSLPHNNLGLADIGVSNENSEFDQDTNIDDETRFVFIFIMFVLIMGVTIYLLVFTRVTDSVTKKIAKMNRLKDDLDENDPRQEMVDFV